MSIAELNTRPLPAELAEEAWITVGDVCALLHMSRSWWHCEVAAGRAPQPVIRAPRCTRWRLATVRNWMAERASAPIDTAAAAVIAGRAKKASLAALAKRRAIASGQL